MLARMAKNKAKTRARPSALARAEHGGAPVHLTAAQRSVLEEALRLGEDLAGEVEAKVSSYGRWVLDTVFKNDAAAALDLRTKNPIWLELVRRAGGPTLRISRRMLYVALQLAAYDKRITDQSWRGLDAGRKELLLPLHDDRRLREAAQRVSKFNLTQTKTREYVTELLAEDGRSRQVRITAPVLLGRVRTLRETLGGGAVLRKVRELHDNLDPSERAAIAGELEKLKDVLSVLTRAMRGR